MNDKADRKYIKGLSFCLLFSINICIYLFISQTGIAHLQQPLSNCTASVWHVT